MQSRLHTPQQQPRRREVIRLETGALAFANPNAATNLGRTFSRSIKSSPNSPDPWKTQTADTAFVFELHSAHASSECFHNKPNEFGRCRFKIKPTRANVRNAVPLRIRESGTRCVGKIGAEAIGRGQTRPLANKHENQPRAEPLCDLVAERYPRPFGNDNLR